MTPFFVGAHPATVHDGPNKGFRLLGGAEDLARQIMTSLNDAERRTALIANRSFGEIVASPQREQDLGQPRGLEISAMDGPTRQRVEALMDTFLASLTPDLVASQKQRVMQQRPRPLPLCLGRFARSGRGLLFPRPRAGNLLAIEFESGRRWVKAARRRWPWLDRWIERARDHRWARASSRNSRASPIESGECAATG